MTDDPLSAYPAMLTVDQVAEILQVKPRTLYAWRTQDAGPPYTQLEGPGSAVRYPREDLRDYIERRTVRRSPEAVS